MATQNDLKNLQEVSVDTENVQEFATAAPNSSVNENAAIEENSVEKTPSFVVPEKSVPASKPAKTKNIFGREVIPHENKHRITGRKKTEWLYGYIFLSPWIIGVLIFFVISMVKSLYWSFYNVEMYRGVNVYPLEHWYDNYASVFRLETELATTLGSFTISLILQLPIIIAFSLIIAMLLNGKIRCRGVFRMIFFLPVIIATGPVMDMLTAEGVATVPMMSSGSLDQLLGSLPTFLSEPITELFNSLILILWNSGIQILIFLSGLQKVSTTMYEAAKIDGANGWETFWKITLPIVKPIILLNSVYTVVALATGGNNEIINLIYDATYTQPWVKGYEYGMAFNWIYTAIIAVILVFVFLLLKEKSDKNVKYEKRLVRLR